MADIELVIKISEDNYKLMQDENYCGILSYAIKNGTPLPKGHGRLIDEEEILKPFKKLGENKLTYWKTDYDGLITILNKTPSVLEAENEVSKWENIMK